MTPTPHDALVRAIFGQPQHAAAELRAVLPPEVLAEFRLETLAPVEGSFIDEGLRASSADLLFTAGLHCGGSGFVYLLFEHQSTLDERLPLRLLRYQARIWERHAAEHPDEPRVPPIVPLLLHHGPRPWPWTPRFASVLAVDEGALAAFGRNVVGFDFVLDDLARQTDEQILERAMDAVARLALVALRSSRNRPRLFEHVAGVMRALESELRGPAVIPALARLASYVLAVDDSPSDEIRSALVAALPSETRSSVMTAADQLRAEGRLEGRLESRREDLLEVLEIKFGALDPAVRARVDQAPLEQLTAWVRRGIVAASLEEVFEA